MGTPAHPGRAAFAAAASLLFGTGLGLALAGKTSRGFAWLGAAAVCALMILVTPWFAFLLLAVHIGASVDAYLVARRSDQPLRFEGWAPATLLVVAVMGLVGLRSGVIEAFKIPSSSMHPTLLIGDHIYVNKLSLLWRQPKRGELIVFRFPCEDDRDYISRVIALAGETVEVRCNVVYVDGKALPQTLVAAKTSYMDHEEETGRWYERAVSRYREHLGDRDHDLFCDAERPERDQHPRTEANVHDFPMRERGAPSCSSQMEGVEQVHEVLGKIVETKTDAAACELQAHYIVPPDHVFVMGDNRDNSNDSRYWGAVPLDNLKGIVSSIWLANGYRFELGRIGRVD